MLVPERFLSELTELAVIFFFFNVTTGSSESKLLLDFGSHVSLGFC